MEYIIAAAEAGVTILSTLLREAEGVVGTAEWDTWRDIDPDTAEYMKWYVIEIAKEARGDKKWLLAKKSADEMVAFEKFRREMLHKDK
jgi:hypothetical protein